MAITLETSPRIINFPRIEVAPIFINIPIQTGIGKIITNPVSNLSEPYIPDWFKELEEKILHGPKPKLKPRKRLKGASKYDIEVVDSWNTQNECGSIIWEKDHRGIWIQSQRVQKSDVFWDPKKDGSYVEPAQAWYTKNNEKIIIPSREILDDNYGKNKERNDTIEKNRDKFLRRYKTRRGNYENLGNYFYKSQRDKELFLKEVEDLGLVRKADRKKSTVEVSPLEYYSRYMSNRYQEDEL